MTDQPKGFDAYFADKKLKSQREKAQVDCKSVLFLTKEEISELEDMRARALDEYCKEYGICLESKDIEEELAALPDRLKLSDKLIFRMSDQGVLLAYALVFCSWPKIEEWTIEQLYINPDYKRQGLGSKLINQIENVARPAEIKATSILSAPKRPKAESFWKTIGYREQEGFETQVFKKEL